MITFPKLSRLQIERASEIFGNLGLLFLAALVFPSLSKKEEINLVEVTSGFLASLICMITSLKILKGGRR